MAASHDAHWAARLKQAVAFFEEFGHWNVPLDYEDAGLASWVRVQRGNRTVNRLRADRLAALEAVGFGFSVQQLAWESSYAQLVSFQRRHGHCRVPRFGKNDGGLGIWVSRQQAAQARGTLSPARKQKLDALGFVWDRQTPKWQRKLDELSAFVAEHGHGDVPHHNARHGSLAAWLVQQRRLYRTGRLPAQRVKELLERKVTFEFADPWPERLEALRAFIRAHGHCDVPSEHALYAWVHQQRQGLRLGKLPKERQTALRALGLGESMVQRFSTRERWETLFCRLQAFERKHGHCRVPERDPDVRLQQWVKEQRQAKRNNALLPEHQRRLEELGFCWEPWAEDWESGFALLLEFHRKHGHVQGPFRLSHPRLSQWVTKNRRYRRRGTLDAERIARLEALGFQWEGERGKRAPDDMLEPIRAFRRAQGHFAVPNEAPHQRLYLWCEQTRASARKGALEPKQHAALVELGFPFTGEELSWERNFERLQSFQRRNGHTRLPEGKLREWLERQRVALHRGSMTAEQEERFVEVDGRP